MGARTKTTVYLAPGRHQAARIRAVQADQSLAEYLRAAVVAQLAEDYDDLETIKKRKKEPTVSFESVMKDLKKRGLV